MLSVLTAHNLQKSLRENVEISVILSDTISQNDGIAFGNFISKKPYAHHVAYISSEEALKMATEEMGIDPTEFTGSNPFSPEITVTMEADYANTDSLTQIVSKLRKDKRVVDVAYTKDEIEGMNRILEPGGCLMGIYPSPLPKTGCCCRNYLGNTNQRIIGWYHLSLITLHAPY